MIGVGSDTSHSANMACKMDCLNLPCLMLRLGCCYWCIFNSKWNAVTAKSSQTRIVFFSAVPTPCGGRRRDDLPSGTPLARLPKSQRQKRISDWLNRSPSVHSVPILDESDVVESYNDTSDQSLPTIPINTAQEDTSTTPITNIDPYETWWNGKVSLYRFLRNALKDHLWSSSKQHETLSAADLIDDEVHSLSTVAHGSSSHSTENALSASPTSLDDLFFVLSPRVLATILYNQLIGCCCCLRWKFSILFQRFYTSHVSNPPETKQPKFFKVPISLDFERMYVGFAVLFILHYFYLLRIVLSRNSRSEQFSRSHRKQDELRFTLDAVVEEEEEDDDDDDDVSDSENEWEHHGVQKDRCEKQFEDLVGRELVVVHSRPIVSSSPFRSQCCTGAQKLSSVTTATTIEAFSFSEDSDDEQQDDSECSSSEHTFPSQFAAVDWYYYQQEVQGPQPINKECQVILR